jgi:hypothetical protein
MISVRTLPAKSAGGVPEACMLIIAVRGEHLDCGAFLP